MPDYLCAVDVGTTGVKAGLFTTQGDLVESGYQEYGVYYPAPNYVEQSVSEIWEAFTATLRAVVSQSGIKPTRVIGLSISNQRATFVPVDTQRRTLTPYIGWQDQRGIEQCQWMKERISPEEYYDITGLDIGTTASVSKILWIKKNQSEIYQRTLKFSCMQDMILSQLCGHIAPCDHATASWTGLLDVKVFDWSQDLLELFGLEKEKLPELTQTGQTIGSISGEAAGLCGLIEGTPLISGAGDAQCSAVGSGATAPGIVSLVMGTAAAIFTYLETPIMDTSKSLYCVAHAVPGKWEMEGSALAAGAVYKWFRDTFGQLEKIVAAETGLDPYELFDKELEKDPTVFNGPLVIPTFMGGGTPSWYSHARGAILGLNLQHSRPDILRSIVEGIFFEIKGMVEAIKACGVKTDRLRIVGGMAKSKTLSKYLANVTGVTVEIPNVHHAALVGAYICAALGSGVYFSAHEASKKLVKIISIFEPEKEKSAIYNRFYQLYCRAFDLLCEHGIFEELNRLTTTN